MSEINKPQRKFMLACFVALFACAGRVTMENLSRYGADSSRRVSRWKRRHFDFWMLNLIALEEQEIITKHKLAAAFDPTFLPKSGKKTYGMGSFYNPAISKSEKGLEASVLALLDLDENTAYTLKVNQTPAELGEETRTDFYTRSIQEDASALIGLVKHLIVDGGFAKKKFVDGVCETGLELVGKLRHDSKLRYLYEGPRRKGKGRPKRYDGQVDYNDLGRMKERYLKNEDIWMYSAVVNHPQFEREIRVVILKKKNKKGKWSHIVLYSTDTKLDTTQLYALYKARFQIEFVIRDGKQYTGFADCQMRDQAGIDFHLNASLTAVNLLRLEDREHKGIDGERVISLHSWKRRKYNEELMKQIFDDLGNELSEEKKKMLQI